MRFSKSEACLWERDMSSFSGGPQSALPPVSSHVLNFPGLEEESKGRDEEAPAAGLQPQQVPSGSPPASLAATSPLWAAG